MPSSSASRSAASPISGSPTSTGANGARSKRSPPCSGGQNRHGAVEADSTPPASTTPLVVLSRAAATSMAARPLPHCRSTVSAGMSTGSPAANVATRATSPPGPVQLPRTTSMISLRLSHSAVHSFASTSAASSGAVTVASDRPAVPIGVRSAPTIIGDASVRLVGARLMACLRYPCSDEPCCVRGHDEPEQRRTVGLTGARQRQPRHAEPHPRAVRWWQHRGTLAQPRSVPGVGQGGRAHGPERVVPNPQHHVLPTGSGAERLLDVGDQHRGTAGGDGVRPPEDYESVAVPPPPVADGGVTVRLAPQRTGRSVVPGADVGGADPDLVVVDPQVDLGERHQILCMPAPGYERQLGGTVVVVDPAAGVRGPGGESGREPVASDHDRDPTQV